MYSENKIRLQCDDKGNIATNQRASSKTERKAASSVLPL